MARTILLIGAGVWALAGVAGLALAVVGTDVLADLLPPLAIDRDALGRTVVTLAVTALGMSVAHLVVIGGLARRRPWAWSAGTLLAGMLAAASLAGVAAAITSAAAGTMELAASVASAVGTLLMTIGYAWAAARLVGDIRSRSRA